MDANIVKELNNRQLSLNWIYFSTSSIKRRSIKSKSSATFLKNINKSILTYERTNSEYSKLRQDWINLMDPYNAGP